MTATPSLPPTAGSAGWIGYLPWEKHTHRHTVSQAETPYAQTVTHAGELLSHHTSSWLMSAGFTGAASMRRSTSPGPGGVNVGSDSTVMVHGLCVSRLAKVPFRSSLDVPFNTSAGTPCALYTAPSGVTVRAVQKPLQLPRSRLIPLPSDDITTCFCGAGHSSRDSLTVFDQLLRFSFSQLAHHRASPERV